MILDLCHERGGPMRIFERITLRAHGSHKEFKCWSSLRSIVAMMIPCCGCRQSMSSVDVDYPAEMSTGSTSKVIGTIFGHRKGHVNLCIQDDPKSLPLLMLEFSTPTPLLAKEMQADQLRIVLECEKTKENCGSHLFSEPMWSMYCNGRKVGFAIKKQSQLCTDQKAIELMESISMGAGIIPVKEGGGHHHEEDLVYMRAHYERVIVSVDSQAFYMINPDSSSQQELSIIFVRS